MKSTYTRKLPQVISTESLVSSHDLYKDTSETSWSPPKHQHSLPPRHAEIAQKSQQNIVNIIDTLKQMNRGIDHYEKEIDPISDYMLHEKMQKRSTVQTKHEEMISILKNVLKCEPAVYLEYRDISHDNWKETLAYERLLERERNVLKKSMNNLKEKCYEKLNFVKEKTAFKIESMEKKLNSVQEEANKNKERLMAMQCDFESYLMKSEHESYTLHQYMRKVGYVKPPKENDLDNKSLHPEISVSLFSTQPDVNQRSSGDTFLPRKDSYEQEFYIKKAAIKQKSSKDTFIQRKDSYENEFYTKNVDINPRTKKPRKFSIKNQPQSLKRSVVRCNSLQRFDNFIYIPVSRKCSDNRYNHDSSKIQDFSESLDITRYDKQYSPELNQNLTKEINFFVTYEAEGSQKIPYSKPRASQLIKKLQEAKDMYREIAYMHIADYQSFFLRESLKPKLSIDKLSLNKRIIKMNPDLNKSTNKRQSNHKYISIHDTSMKSFQSVQNTSEDEERQLSPSKFFDHSPTKRSYITQNAKEFDKRKLPDECSNLQSPRKYDIGSDFKKPVELRPTRTLSNRYMERNIDRNTERNIERNKPNAIIPKIKKTKELGRFEKFKQRSPDVINQLSARDSLNFTLPICLGKLLVEDLRQVSPIKKQNVESLNKLFSLKQNSGSFESSSSLQPDSSSSPNGGKFSRYLDRLK